MYKDDNYNGIQAITQKWVVGKIMPMSIGVEDGWGPALPMSADLENK